MVDQKRISEVIMSGGPEVDVDAVMLQNGGPRARIDAESPADADYFEQISPLAEPNGLLNEAGMEQPMMDNSMQFLFTGNKQPMVNSASKVMSVSIPTSCDVLCTTNTIINYVIPAVEITQRDTVGILPYKGRKTTRITKLTKGETPWQKYKMSGARIDRNDDLHNERDEFMEKLEKEKYEKEFFRFVMACRIQALYRGYQSRLIHPKGDNRHLKPMPYIPRKKPKFIIRPTVLQDELCELASFLDLNPIPGLNLVSRTKASKRMKKIQYAAALSLTKFFRLIVAKKRCKQIVQRVREDRRQKAAVTVARFFKSLKLRTFAYRSKMEKRRRAVQKIQNMCRKWHSFNRVRVLRREVVRFRLTKNAAIVLQRSFRRVYGGRVMKRLALAEATMSAMEPTIHDQSFEEAVDVAAEDMREDFMIDEALAGIFDAVWNEAYGECIDVEEQHQIFLAVQRAAEEAARLERERVILELELARQKKEEEERLRREEEERQHMEELRRKREDERKEKERLKQLEIDRIIAEKEAAIVAAEAAAVAKKAAEEATTLAEYASLTATMGSTMARLQAEEPVVDSKEMEELMEFKKTLDKQKAEDAANTRVWSLATPQDPANAFLGVEKQARDFKSVEEETADELSGFYISTVLEKTRPGSAETSIARRSVSQIIEDAKAKAREMTGSHSIKSPHKHYSIGTVSDIMKESKRLEVSRSSPFYEAFQLLGSAKVFYTSLEHANSITLVNEAAGKLRAVLDGGKDLEDMPLSDSMHKFGRYTEQELSLLRGLCEMAMCDYERALATLGETLVISKELFGADYHPGHFEVEIGMVSCYVYQGEHELAIKKLQRLRSAQEEYAKITHGAGTDVSQLGSTSITSSGQEEKDHFSDLQTRLASPYHSLYCRMSYELKLAAVHYKEGDYLSCSHHLDEAIVLLDTSVFKGNDHVLFDIEVNTLQAKLDDVTSEGGEKTLMMWSRVMSLKRNLYEKDDGEEVDTHPEMVSSMVHLATVLIEIGDLKAAHSLATQAFTIRNEYYEDSHPALAVCYFLKANYLRKYGRYTDALTALETCTKTMRTHFKQGHYWHAKCSLLAAEIVRERGQPHLAQPLYEECLSQQEKTYEKFPLHRTILDGYLGMARNQRDLGIYDEALSWYERAISMNEELSRLFGVKTHCKLESCRINIGEIKVILGEIREGKELISSAGKALAELTSDKHVTISDGLLAFGRARSLEGKYNDAHSLYMRCMDIRSDLLGPQSPAVAEVWQAIADNHRIPGTFDEAVAADDASMTIRSQLFQPESIPVCNSLHSRANILRDLNKPEEAEPFYKQALGIIAEICGEQSLLYNQILGDYGDNLRVSRKLPEACEMLQTAVSGIQALVGKKHILNADHMRTYAMANIDIMAEDKHHIAIVMLEDSVLPIYMQVVGGLHPATLFTKGLIGLVDVLNVTPRTARTADDLSERTTPQDNIDDALDFFSCYKQRPFTALQPWVRYLGGYLEDRHIENRHHRAAQAEAQAAGEAKKDEEEEGFAAGEGSVAQGSLQATSISSLGTPGF